jgi:hypothetical protein
VGNGNNSALPAAAEINGNYIVNSLDKRAGVKYI